MTQPAEFSHIHFDAQDDIEHGDHTIFIGLRERDDTYKAYGLIYSDPIPFTWNTEKQVKKEIDKTSDAVNTFINELKQRAEKHNDHKQTAKNHLKNAIRDQQ